MMNRIDKRKIALMTAFFITAGFSLAGLGIGQSYAKVTKSGKAWVDNDYVSVVAGTKSSATYKDEKGYLSGSEFYLKDSRGRGSDKFGGPYFDAAALAVGGAINLEGKTNANLYSDVVDAGYIHVGKSAKLNVSYGGVHVIGNGAKLSGYTVRETSSGKSYKITATDAKKSSYLKSEGTLNSNGVEALYGGRADINKGKITTFSGYDDYNYPALHRASNFALQADNKGSIINAKNTTIDGGISAWDYGKVNLTNVNIYTNNYGSNGFYATDGGVITMNGGKATLRGIDAADSEVDDPNQDYEKVAIGVDSKSAIYLKGSAKVNISNSTSSDGSINVYDMGTLSIDKGASLLSDGFIQVDDEDNFTGTAGNHAAGKFTSYGTLRSNGFFVLGGASAKIDGVNTTINTTSLTLPTSITEVDYADTNKIAVGSRDAGSNLYIKHGKINGSVVAGKGGKLTLQDSTVNGTDIYAQDSGTSLNISGGTSKVDSLTVTNGGTAVLSNTSTVLANGGKVETSSSLKASGGVLSGDMNVEGTMNSTNTDLSNHLITAANGGSVSLNGGTVNSTTLQADGTNSVIHLTGNSEGVVYSGFSSLRGVNGGKISVDGGMLRADNLRNLTATSDDQSIVLNPNGYISTKTGQIFEKGIDETNRQTVRDSKESGDVTNTKIDYAGGTIKFTDGLYTDNYVNDAKSHLGNAKMVMTGHRIEGDTKNIDDVTAGVLEDGIMVNANAENLVFGVSSNPNGITSESGVTIDDANTKYIDNSGLSMSSLNLSESAEEAASGTNPEHHVILTNGSSLGLGGSYDGELIYVDDQVPTGDVDVIVGTTQSFTGESDEQSVSQLEIGDPSISKGKNFNLLGNLIVNKNGSVSLKSGNLTTKNVTVNGGNISRQQEGYYSSPIYNSLKTGIFIITNNGFVDTNDIKANKISVENRSILQVQSLDAPQLTVNNSSNVGAVSINASTINANSSNLSVGKLNAQRLSIQNGTAYVDNGGTLDSKGSSKSLTVDKSVAELNKVTVGGGGIWENNASTLRVKNSKLNGNLDVRGKSVLKANNTSVNAKAMTVRDTGSKLILDANTANTVYKASSTITGTAKDQIQVIGGTLNSSNFRTASKNAANGSVLLKNHGVLETYTSQLFARGINSSSDKAAKASTGAGKITNAKVNVQGGTIRLDDKRYGEKYLASAAGAMNGSKAWFTMTGKESDGSRIDVNKAASNSKVLRDKVTINSGKRNLVVGMSTKNKNSFSDSGVSVDKNKADYVSRGFRATKLNLGKYSNGIAITGKAALTLGGSWNGDLLAVNNKAAKVNIAVGTSKNRSRDKKASATGRLYIGD